MIMASQSSVSSLSLPPDTYIFDITAVRGTSWLAAISSDDSLRVVDATTLREASRPAKGFGVHTGVTCLRPIDDQAGKVLTAGRDGLARLWDLRSGAAQVELRDGNVGVRRRYRCSSY